MKPIETWHVIVANLLALAIILTISRWSRPLFLGAVATIIIVLPIAFAYFSGRLSVLEAAMPIIGIIVLAADISGKLPSRSKVRQKIGIEKRTNVLK